MLAGPPATNTRSTRSGTSTRRPALSTTVRASTVADVPASTAARSTAPTRRRRTLVLADHDVGGLDDGVGLVALVELQLIHRLVGDGRGDDGAVDVDLHVRRGGAPGDLDHASLQHVARAQLHDVASGSAAGRESVHPAARWTVSTWPESFPSAVVMC